MFGQPVPPQGHPISHFRWWQRGGFHQLVRYSFWKYNHELKQLEPFGFWVPDRALGTYGGGSGDGGDGQNTHGMSVGGGDWPTWLSWLEPPMSNPPPQQNPPAVPPKPPEVVPPTGPTGPQDRSDAVRPTQQGGVGLVPGVHAPGYTPRTLGELNPGSEWDEAIRRPRVSVSDRLSAVDRILDAATRAEHPTNPGWPTVYWDQSMWDDATIVANGFGLRWYDAQPRGDVRPEHNLDTHPEARHTVGGYPSGHKGWTGLQGGFLDFTYDWDQEIAGIDYHLQVYLGAQITMEGYRDNTWTDHYFDSGYRIGGRYFLPPGYSDILTFYIDGGIYFQGTDDRTADGSVQGHGSTGPGGWFGSYGPHHATYYFGMGGKIELGGGFYIEFGAEIDHRGHAEPSFGLGWIIGF